MSHRSINRPVASVYTPRVNTNNLSVRGDSSVSSAGTRSDRGAESSGSSIRRSGDLGLPNIPAYLQVEANNLELEKRIENYIVHVEGRGLRQQQQKRIKKCLILNSWVGRVASIVSNKL
jgi:hypothetical protein